MVVIRAEAACGTERPLHRCPDDDCLVVGVAGEGQLTAVEPLARGACEPAVDLAGQRPYPVAHAVGQGAILGLEHAERRGDLVVEKPTVHLEQGVESLAGARNAGIHGGRPALESTAKLSGELHSEVGLAREVVVDGRRLDPERLGQVAVAKPDEAMPLKQGLGDLEDSRPGVRMTRYGTKLLTDPPGARHHALA